MRVRGLPASSLKTKCRTLGIQMLPLLNWLKAFWNPLDPYTKQFNFFTWCKITKTRKRGVLLEPIVLAREIVNILEEKFAEEILLLDLKGLSDFTDCFVIATGSSERLLDSLATFVKEEIKKQHGYNASVEGSGQTGWVILDFGYVVVHLLSEALREFYDLEGLWQNAKIVISVQ